MLAAGGTNLENMRAVPARRAASASASAPRSPIPRSPRPGRFDEITRRAPAFVDRSRMRAAGRPPRGAMTARAGAPRRSCSLLSSLALAGRRAPPRAGTEEFSTFDVEAQEEDDESLLDHFLTAPAARVARRVGARAAGAPHRRRAASPRGSGSSTPTSSCARRSASARASASTLRAVDESDARATTTSTSRSASRPGSGTPGVMFRPLYDKSRQDFGADVGRRRRHHRAYQLQAGVRARGHVQQPVGVPPDAGRRDLRALRAAARTSRRCASGRAQPALARRGRRALADARRASS